MHIFLGQIWANFTKKAEIWKATNRVHLNFLDSDDGDLRRLFCFEFAFKKGELMQDEIKMVLSSEATPTQQIKNQHFLPASDKHWHSARYAQKLKQF